MARVPPAYDGERKPGAGFIVVQTLVVPLTEPLNLLYVEPYGKVFAYQKGFHVEPIFGSQEPLIIQRILKNSSLKYIEPLMVLHLSLWRNP